jgi:linoleoyl-CoA desaturase
MSKLSFQNNQSPFFRTLKGKVDKYFSQNQIHTSGNTKLYIKSIIQIVSAIGLYIALVFYTPGVLVSIALCILLGINLGVIGFNVMHEGGHMCFSKHKWLNKVSGYFLNILGGNIYYWKIKHNINHHTYTNISGMDADIELEPFMRIHTEQTRRKFHRYQHIYAFFLYGISYMVWIFFEDFNKYFSKRATKVSEPKNIELQEHIIFWLSKISYISIYLVLPAFMIGFVPTIIGFVIIAFACGLSIGIVFQLAHVVEDTDFPTPNAESNKIEQEWAIHQLSTTANFATKNKIVSWLLGGLNFQVEHHLFPRISHIHYPIINQLVKETCLEFNVRYIEYSSMFGAFRSHIAHIKSMGRA